MIDERCREKNSGKAILGGVPYRERVKSRRTNINNNVKGKLLVST
jgi:hypothetical protein